MTAGHWPNDAMFLQMLSLCFQGGVGVLSGLFKQHQFATGQVNIYRTMLTGNLSLLLSVSPAILITFLDWLIMTLLWV